MLKEKGPTTHGTKETSLQEPRDLEEKYEHKFDSGACGNSAVSPQPLDTSGQDCSTSSMEHYQSCGTNNETKTVSNSTQAVYQRGLDCVPQVQDSSGGYDSLVTHHPTFVQPHYGAYGGFMMPPDPRTDQYSWHRPR